MLLVMLRGKVIKRFSIANMKKDMTFTELEAFLNDWFEYDKIKWVKPVL